jgi:hypothetical protein
MNFKDLLSKLNTIDKPVEECGAMPVTQPAQMTPPAAPPSMSVNLNAQGMDNIKDLMQLFSKVNPDMMPKGDMPMPSMTDPIIKIGAISKPEPMKMLPKPEPTKMMAKPEEAWQNEPDEDHKGMDAVVRNGNDLNRSKKTFPKVAGGDNPMQRMESQEDIIKSIENQLRHQLEEMKGNR